MHNCIIRYIHYAPLYSIYSTEPNFKLADPSTPILLFRLGTVPDSYYIRFHTSTIQTSLYNRYLFKLD